MMEEEERTMKSHEMDSCMDDSAGNGDGNFDGLM